MSNIHSGTGPYSGTAKEKITLAGAEVTLLSAVWCRAQDATGPEPLLGDHYAKTIMDHCDVDYSRGTLSALQDERWARLGAGRAKALDDWCQAFLDAHADEPIQVLQIACGLDSRVLRLRRGPNVRWIDVDRPLVVNLRERIYAAARWTVPDEGGEYFLRNLSVTSDKWLRDIPQDRRTLVVAEGLLYYLAPEQAGKVIRDVVDHFSGGGGEGDEGSGNVTSPGPRGEFILDVLGSIIQKRTSQVEWLRPTGIKCMSGFDNPSEIEAFHPRLKLLECHSWDEIMNTERKVSCAPPWFGTKGTRVASLLSSFWDFCQVMRFEF